jgi:hypothetical protein
MAVGRKSSREGTGTAEGTITLLLLPRRGVLKGGNILVVTKSHPMHVGAHGKWLDVLTQNHCGWHLSHLRPEGDL